MSFRRRMMMAANNKPYDAEVEYLEAQQGAYIDTGIKASSSVQIKTKIYDYFNNTSLFSRWPFGGRNNASNAAFGLFVNGLNLYLYYAYGSTSQQLYLYSNYPNTAEVEMKQGTLKVGSITHTISTAVFASSYNLYLFCLNNGGTATIGTGIRLGDTYVTNGTKTLDLIAVRKNGVGYMYDKVSGQLFGTAGTGNFILGPDKQ